MIKKSLIYLLLLVPLLAVGQSWERVFPDSRSSRVMQVEALENGDFLAMVNNGNDSCFGATLVRYGALGEVLWKFGPYPMQTFSIDSTGMIYATALEQSSATWYDPSIWLHMSRFSSDGDLIEADQMWNRDPLDLEGGEELRGIFPHNNHDWYIYSQKRLWAHPPIQDEYEIYTLEHLGSVLHMHSEGVQLKVISEQGLFTTNESAGILEHHFFGENAQTGRWTDSAIHVGIGSTLRTYNTAFHLVTAVDLSQQLATIAQISPVANLTWVSGPNADSTAQIAVAVNAQGTIEKVIQIPMDQLDEPGPAAVGSTGFLATGKWDKMAAFTVFDTSGTLVPTRQADIAITKIEIIDAALGGLVGQESSLYFDVRLTIENQGSEPVSSVYFNYDRSGNPCFGGRYEWFRQLDLPPGGIATIRENELYVHEIEKGPGASVDLCFEALAPDALLDIDLSSNMACQTYSGVLSTEELLALGNWKVFPNPTAYELQLQSTANVSGSVSIQVIDLAGRVVLTEQGRGNSTSLDVSELAAGTYSLKLRTEDAVFQQLFVKE